MNRRDLLRSVTPIAAVAVSDGIRSDMTLAATEPPRAETVDVVRDFGADPTGAAPSNGNFTRAFAARRPVYVPPGTYVWDAAISPPAGARCFATRGTAIIRAAPHPATDAKTPDTANRLLTVIASDVLFDGLTFDGNGEQVNSDGVVCMVYGGHPGGVERVVFERCDFRHARGIAAFFATSVRQSGLRDCRFTDCGNYWRRGLKATATFQGYWNAATNTPRLQSGIGSEGQYYAVFGAGNTPLDGITSWSAGEANHHHNDIAMFLGGRWVKRNSAETSATTVFGQGTVDTDIGNFVVDCDFTDVSFDVISAYSQRDWLVSGNRIDVTGGIVNFAGEQGGIGVGQGINCSIIGNMVRGCAGSGCDCIDTRGLIIANNFFSHNGVTGIVIGVDYGNVMSEVVIANNICLNNHLYPSPLHQGGITLGGPLRPGPPAVLRNVNISGNICTDNQSVKTQRYGLHIFPGATLDNVWIDSSNAFAGNLMGEIGGHAVGYSVRRGPLPTVTGSFADGGALKSTLAALVELGLVTDKTTR